MWVEEHDSFTGWHDSNKILWINGKPGSGKSTIARMIISRLSTPARTSRTVVASFFYNAKVGPHATNHENMLQSILYQILDQDHSLYLYYQDSYRSLCEDTSTTSASTKWKHLLDTIFEKLVLDTTAARGRLYCILDGLDESNTTSDVLLERQEQMQSNAITRLLLWLSRLVAKGGQNPWLKLIVISRPLNEISRGMGNVLQIKVEAHNAPTIKTIINTRLEKIKTKMTQTVAEDNSNLDPVLEAQVHELLAPIVHQLEESANGVILWVVLVLDLLEGRIEEGSYTIDSLESVLRQGIPKDLNALYEELVERLQRRNKLDGARNMLSWACFAKRPLLLSEFRDAIAVSTSKTQTPSSLERNRYVLLGGSWRPVERAIIDTCGCLIEVVRAFPRGNNLGTEKEVEVGPDCFVQIAHRTVKEYLENTGKNIESKPLRIQQEEADSLIYKSLMDYVKLSLPMLDASSMDATRWTISDYNAFTKHLQNRPLLAYAFESLRHHESNPDIIGWMQELSTNTGDFRTSHSWCLVREWARSLDYQNQGRESQNLSMESFIPRLFESASKAQHNHTLRLLVLPYFRPSDIEYSRACLKAIRNQSNITAAVLLRNRRPQMHGLGNKQINTELRDSSESEGSEQIVKLLIETGADIESEDQHGRTALHFAARNKDPELLRILLLAGANTEKADNFGRTPLMKAAYSCRESSVGLLLSHGASVSHLDLAGMNVLHLALRTAYLFQETGCVKQLLDAGADITVQDRTGMTPMDIAVELGDDLLVKLVSGGPS